MINEDNVQDAMDEVNDRIDEVIIDEVTIDTMKILKNLGSRDSMALLRDDIIELVRVYNNSKK